MAQQKSVLDEVSSGIGAAVSDVRAKLEEVIWGREVTERDSQAAPQWPQAKEPEREASFGGVKRTIDMGNPTQDQMQGNANYRLAAMEQELNGPQWPQAKENEPGRDTGLGRGASNEDRERGNDIDR